MSAACRLAGPSSPGRRAGPAGPENAGLDEKTPVGLDEKLEG